MSVQVVYFTVSGVSLQLMETGVRRLDMSLAPINAIIEGPLSGDQRRFLSDPERSNTMEALTARILARKQAPPEFQAASATIFDSLPESTASSESERVPRGLATFGDFSLQVTRRTMDELLRQWASGQPILNVSLGITGLQHTTEQNNEGGLIRYAWSSEKEQQSIKEFRVSYGEGAMYAKSAQRPPSPTRDDFISFQRQMLEALADVARQLRRQRLVSVIGASLVLLVLLWKLHS
jgi:hypothetical protein